MARGSALVATAVAFAVWTSSAVTWASPTGVAGYTGKPSAFAPQGESCTPCHSGGTSPSVALAGPTSLNAGQMAAYTLTVTTGASVAGGGVAATNGVVLNAGTGFRDSFGEMVHSAPRTITGGKATFGFNVVAPQYGGTVRLWAVGLAANNNGANSGDLAAHTTFDVAINGPPPPPDAGAGTTADASPGTFANGDGAADSSRRDAKGPGTMSGDGDPDDPGDPGDDDLRHARDGACAMTMYSRSSGAGAFALTFGLAIAALSRRRREV